MGGHVKKHCSGKMSGKRSELQQRWGGPSASGQQGGLEGFFCLTGPLIIPSQPAHPFHTKLTSLKEAFPLGHRLREVLTCQHTSKGHKEPLGALSSRDLQSGG